MGATSSTDHHQIPNMINKSKSKRHQKSHSMSPSMNRHTDRIVLPPSAHQRNPQLQRHKLVNAITSVSEHLGIFKVYLYTGITAARWGDMADSTSTR